MFLNKNKHKSSFEQAAPEVETAKKGEIFSWAMFDFANSSYTTVIITAVFSAFFIDYIVPEESTSKIVIGQLLSQHQPYSHCFCRPLQAQSAISVGGRKDISPTALSFAL